MNNNEKWEREMVQLYLKLYNNCPLQPIEELKNAL